MLALIIMIKKNKQNMWPFELNLWKIKIENVHVIKILKPCIELVVN